VHTGSVQIFHHHSPESSARARMRAHTHTEYMLLTQVNSLLCMQPHTTGLNFFLNLLRFPFVSALYYHKHKSVPRLQPDSLLSYF